MLKRFIATTAVLVGVSACASPPEANGEAAGEPPVAAENDLTFTPAGKTCDQNELFVMQGLAQDMRDTLSAAFVTSAQVRVPGAIIAYEGYGGDLVQAPLGVSARAERVFDPHPGGAFSATFGGNPTGTKFEKRGFTTAKALFDAMVGATETSTSSAGWKETTRTSKAGTFSCVVRAQGSKVAEASCSFSGLLTLEIRSWPTSATGFCIP